MSRLPTVKHKYINRITPTNTDIDQKERKIVFSFESIQYNEYFNIDMTCPKWTGNLFEKLQDLSTKSLKDLRSSQFTGKNSTYRFHSHENANPPCPFPDNINPKEFYQFRISKSNGAIHGVFNENVFYIIWLDPLHNMYPDENYGGAKKVVPPKTCCMELNEENESIKEQLETYKEMFDRL